MPAKRISTEWFGRELWVRQLSDFRFGVLIINRAGEARDYGFEWKDLNLSPAIPMKVTNEWTGDVIAENVKGEFSCHLESHEAAVLTLTPML